MMLVENNINNKNIQKLVKKYNPDYIFLPNVSKLSLHKNYRLNFAFKNYKLIESIKKIRKKFYKNLSFLLSTSGSTGSPKFVRISHDNLLYNTRSIIDYLKIKPSHKVITTLPMNYTYGLSVVNTHLYVGATIILTEDNLLSKEFWSLLKKTKVTSLSGVPYMYEILNKLKLYQMNLPHLKYFTQAGGKLSNNLILKFAQYCLKNKKKFFVMYGQVEATARMAYLPYKYIIKKIGSIGKPLTNCKIKIHNEYSKPIKDNNKSGELIFYGKNVSLGYAENYSDLAKGDENKGILKTGDIATKDKDGFYYIIGRNNRYAKLFGKRISLEDVDEEIISYGYESASTVKNDKLYIHIVLNNKKNIKDLTNLIKIRIADFLRINNNVIYIIKIKKLPRNNYGKIIYNDLFEKI